MTQMICLANSWRPGGRCVAGIDVDTGEWVRPVPPGGGAIPESRTYMQGRYLELLDVVEVDLDEPTLTTRYQRENRAVRNWDWQRVRVATVDEVLEYRSRDRWALHGQGQVVEPSLMEQLPPEQWVSLQLFATTNAAFRLGPYRWQAYFSVGRAGSRYCISITDPVAAQQLDQGENISAKCLLTLSLTEPVEVYGKPELCYKLVAGVIESE